MPQQRRDQQPKLLVLDIETAPGTAYVWNLFDSFIPIERLIEPHRIISWGAKWSGSREVMYADERAGKMKMLAKIHGLLAQADAVITYNGDRFDLPNLHGAFLEHNLPVLPPLASIDLYKTVKKLGFISRKLEFVAPLLKIGKKVEHEGFRLWKSVMAGDKAAWERMKRYNCQDVNLTDELYRILQPHVKNHPRLFPKVKDSPTCRVCDSDHVIFRGSYYTKECQYSRVQCCNCGSWDKVKKKALKPMREDRE